MITSTRLWMDAACLVFPTSSILVSEAEGQPDYVGLHLSRCFALGVLLLCSAMLHLCTVTVNHSRSLSEQAMTIFGWMAEQHKTYSSTKGTRSQ